MIQAKEKARQCGGLLCSGARYACSRYAAGTGKFFKNSSTSQKTQAMKDSSSFVGATAPRAKYLNHSARDACLALVESAVTAMGARHIQKSFGFLSALVEHSFGCFQIVILVGFVGGISGSKGAT